MKDIIDVTADYMRSKSIEVNLNKIKSTLIVVNKRLKSATDRELENHSIFIPLSDIDNYDNAHRSKIIIKEITPFLIDNGYTVETETFKADNIEYFKGISISW